MKDSEKQIRLGVMLMVASQFDFTSDEIEIINNKHNRIAPLVVNSAFACELYLKALILITTNKISSGHDLKKLFDKQEEFIKKEIFLEYKKTWLESQIAYNVPSEFQTVVNETEFEKDICEVKNSFIDWRYVFEKEDRLTIRMGVLNNLRLSLRTILDKHYDWQA